MTPRRSQRPKAHAATVTTLALDPSPAPFTTSDSFVAYEHFLPLAMTVPAEGLAHYRHDPVVAAYNVRSGVAAIRPHLVELARRTPDVTEAELLELPALALALLHAAGRVPAGRVSAREIDARITRIKDPRAMAVQYLEVAAYRGLVPVERVRRLREAGGKIKMASDCVLVAGMFREFAEALEGCHPFDATFLQGLAEDGAWLQAMLRPQRYRREATPRPPEAVVRDRFAKLLGDRYDRLRAVAFLLFGTRQTKVPPLHSRKRGASKRQGASEPEGVDDV